MSALTPARVLELKREARELSQREDIKHSAALARIAQAEGFRSWEELIGRAGGTEVVRAAKVPTEAQVRRAQRRKDFV